MKLKKGITSKRSVTRFQTLESDFNKIHNHEYSYEKAVYESAKTKLIITCKKHGDFLQSPNVHLRGDGCPKCGHIKTVANAVNIASTTFEDRANSIHKGKYIYDLVEYKNARTKVKIKCKKHGVFEQSPDNHLKGKGCKKCATEEIAKNQTFTIEEVINMFNSIHNQYYDYSKLIYSGMSKKITVTCPEHGDFKIRAQHHLNGSGCASCAKFGFDQNKPAILYYLKISDGRAYKIGITNRSVKERFPKDMEKIIILKTWYYKIGFDAQKQEQKILKQFKHQKYTGPELLNNGNSELFEFDILNLDN